MQTVFEDMMGLPNVPQMILHAKAKAARATRLDGLVDVADFIQVASLRECKHIICALIDRVSELTGSASELEDASVALTDAIDYEPCQPRCLCDSCAAARSDEAYDRQRDGELMRRAA